MASFLHDNSEARDLLSTVVRSEKCPCRGCDVSEDLIGARTAPPLCRSLSLGSLIRGINSTFVAKFVLLSSHIFILRFVYRIYDRHHCHHHYRYYYYFILNTINFANAQCEIICQLVGKFSQNTHWGQNKPKMSNFLCSNPERRLNKGPSRLRLTNYFLLCLT